jgi:hypothetical protein
MNARAVFCNFKNSKRLMVKHKNYYFDDIVHNLACGENDFDFFVFYQLHL